LGASAHGLRTPEFLITNGGAGLERALAVLCPPQPFHALSRAEPWAAPPDVPAQRCTVHKHRNLLPSAGFPSAVADGTFASFAHAPDALHEEVTADYTDMIYAATAKEMAG